MKDFEKVRVLLPHWIEHNSGHESEYLQWAETVRGAGMETVANAIELAVEAMREANTHLQSALLEIGGPLDDGHTHLSAHHSP